MGEINIKKLTELIITVIETDDSQELLEYLQVDLEKGEEALEKIVANMSRSDLDEVLEIAAKCDSYVASRIIFTMAPALKKEYIKIILDDADRYNLDSYAIVDLAKRSGDTAYIKKIIEEKREQFGWNARELVNIIASTEDSKYIETCILNGEKLGLGVEEQIELIKNANWDFVVEELFAGPVDESKDNRIKLPHDFAQALSQAGCFEDFCKDSDFRFFKNEIPQINDMTVRHTKEEITSFYKFASALGCFSTDKIKDKYGRETESMLAQKASSFLARLLKTNDMQLR